MRHTTNVSSTGRTSYKAAASPSVLRPNKEAYHLDVLLTALIHIEPCEEGERPDRRCSSGMPPP